MLFGHWMDHPHKGNPNVGDKYIADGLILQTLTDQIKGIQIVYFLFY